MQKSLNFLYQMLRDCEKRWFQRVTEARFLQNLSSLHLILKKCKFTL